MKTKKFKIEICTKNVQYMDGTREVRDVHFTNDYHSFLKRLAPANSMFWYDYDIIVYDNKTGEEIDLSL